MYDICSIQAAINQSQANLSMSLMQSMLLAQMQTQAILPTVNINECCTNRITHKTNCCNCGAPLRIHKCDYCGTINN